MDLDGSVSGQGLFSFESGRSSQLLNVFSMAQLIYTHTLIKVAGITCCQATTTRQPPCTRPPPPHTLFILFCCFFFFFFQFFFFPVLFWSGPPRPPGDFPANRIIIRSNKQIKMDRCNTLPFNSNRTSYRESFSFFFGMCHAGIFQNFWAPDIFFYTTGACLLWIKEYFLKE